MWKADHSVVNPSYSLDQSQTPCTTYAHYLLSSHYHHTMLLAHNEFQQVELFFPIKNEWQTTLILSTLPVQLLSWKYCCVHVIWCADCYCCVELNTCTIRTHACQLSVKTPLAGIKYGTLLLELLMYLTFHNTQELCMENWKQKNN
jgi:hypothetical protein